MVKAGSVITFTVIGTTGEYLPRAVGSVRAKVIDGLTPFFDVADVSFSTASLLADPFHSFINWPYTATVRATVRADYGDIRDVDSIVAHAFYNASGNVPTVTSAGLEPGQVGNTSTGVGLTSTLVLVAVILALVVAVKLT